MKFLLDTHVLLWSLNEPEKLDEARTRMVKDRSNTVFVSSITIAEISIKCSLGKLTVEGDILHAVRESGFEWLDFSAEAAALLRDLPYHHKDPFDRMLVAQSLTLNLPLMSDDGKLGKYGCRLV